MDPNEVLRLIRLCSDAWEKVDSDLDRANIGREALDLIEDLDSWLSREGFLPTDWER